MLGFWCCWIVVGQILHPSWHGKLNFWLFLFTLRNGVILISIFVSEHISVGERSLSVLWLLLRRWLWWWVSARCVEILCPQRCCNWRGKTFFFFFLSSLVSLYTKRGWSLHTYFHFNNLAAMRISIFFLFFCTWEVLSCNKKINGDSIWCSCFMFYETQDFIVWLACFPFYDCSRFFLCLNFASCSVTRILTTLVAPTLVVSLHIRLRHVKKNVSARTCYGVNQSITV